MDWFKRFRDGLFGIKRDSPDIRADRNDDITNDFNSDKQESSGSGSNERWFEYRSDHFPPFPSMHDDMEKFRDHMEKTFDEVFKLFGANNIPFFDPWIPPHSDGNGNSDRSSRHPTINGNIRERMLKSNKEDSPDDDRNVRDRMLKREVGQLQSPRRFDPKTYSYTPFHNKSKSQQDTNMDSLLKNGGDINEILDQELNPSKSNRNEPTTNHYFRYSSIVTTRKSDGTIETRRVTRDQDGNEKETVEVTRDASGGELGKDIDLRSRFLKDHDFPDEDWVKRFFRW